MEAEEAPEVAVLDFCWRTTGTAEGCSLRGRAGWFLVDPTLVKRFAVETRVEFAAAENLAAALAAIETEAPEAVVIALVVVVPAVIEAP